MIKSQDLIRDYFLSRRFIRQSALLAGLVNGLLTAYQTLNAGFVVLFVLALFGTAVAVLMDWSLYALIDPLVDRLLNHPTFVDLTNRVIAYPIAYAIVYTIRAVIWISSTVSATFNGAYLGGTEPYAGLFGLPRYSLVRHQSWVICDAPKRKNLIDTLFGRKHGAYLLHPMTQCLQVPCNN